MKNLFSRTSIMCLVFVLLASITTLNVIPVNAEAEGFKIGVVDISGVFEKYDKRKDLDLELKDMEKEFQDEINKKKKEMIDLDEETQLLDLGSETRRKNEDMLERKNVELEGYAKFAERQLLKRYKNLFEQIYGEVVKKVEEVGEKNGYDLIIKKEEPELKSGQISDLQFKIGIRTVLYHSKAVDITANIIEHLNSEYSREKEKK
ncbi:MAG: OmpH family outer membrane protein [Candidatus Scalindua sp.]